MSDALNYLMKIRPDEMKAYFKFVKKAGEHLDPKTRAIILTFLLSNFGTEITTPYICMMVHLRDR